MGQLSSKLRNVAGGGLSFLCLGCAAAGATRSGFVAHTVWVGDGPGPRWGWNGDAERPVFTPSVLVEHDRWEPPVTPENFERWMAAPWQRAKVQHRCHSFVGCNGAQPGQIVFLGDCTHPLAGQTVDLPDWPGRED